MTKSNDELWEEALAVEYEIARLRIYEVAEYLKGNRPEMSEADFIQLKKSTFSIKIMRMAQAQERGEDYLLWKLTYSG